MWTENGQKSDENWDFYSLDWTVGKLLTIVPRLFKARENSIRTKLKYD